MRLDLADLPALLFRNSARGNLNVVYRRARRQYRLDRSRSERRRGATARRQSEGIMMDIADLHHAPERDRSAPRVANKKQLLQELARRAAPLTGLHERDIFDTLLERERLGSTGIGTRHRHAARQAAGLARPIFGLFARLERPIHFEAVDDQPVDLVFLLLTPDSAGADHLKALARVSRLLRDRAICEKLRGTDSADALYALLTDRTASHAA